MPTREGGAYAGPPDPLLHPAASPRGSGAARRGGVGDRELQPPADRRHSRHHQRPGADQHRHHRPLAGRDRAEDHLSDRNRHGRAAARGAGALAFALRTLPGNGDLRGGDRYLLRPAARQRAAAGGPGEPAARLRGARAGADFDRSGGDLLLGDRVGLHRPPRRRLAVLAGRPADHPGMDREAAGADGAGGDRGQLHRRTCAAVPCHARSGAPAGARAHLPRHLRGPRREQRQRRRRLHRAPR